MIKKISRSMAITCTELLFMLERQPADTTTLINSVNFHYFAKSYVFLPEKSADGSEEWEKLNDCYTTVVPWSEVEADAFGTLKPNHSAYLLLYVRSDATWLVADDMMTEEEAFQNLPIDLQDQVNTHRKEWSEALQR